ncbi:hypothetical protein acsn021_11580 [Anaerocolumna cellulosilytica]|uniref:HicB-like antitoxin of toxin-antitoxin system domain-containing protein n=1 Tax=Anaerocolumna cellulosilytica TaxID=433286 RepID=A0A6S6QX13_9FIRM|nr:type II toxin-antitoxin system HicB family antitoxin [Anaerocolumna cellulosilytica]MBB5194644.1 putative RNase H-like HicB family nuclease [Anaerocolumna cellulosilytica]BCJ93589.1 hypothetical protein acsn021_11580 [Anaerocolumna cellulosilytica]
MKNISYYAVLNYDNDGISISFPDFQGCLSCAWTIEEALVMAKEALELYVEDVQINKVPKASLSESILLREKDKLSLITIDI